MIHLAQDIFSLEFARYIAAGLPSHPEWRELALANLTRWEARNADAPQLLRCYQEWRDLLAMPEAEFLELLLSPTDRGQQVRQGMPFVGVLGPREVWAMKARIRQEIADGAVAPETLAYLGRARPCTA